MLARADILGAFVTPGLAAAGAALVSAPILIHLLARRRFKRIRWAAMEFLIDAERRNRRRIRMEEWILLALRCLAVFLIGLLVARPFVNPGILASAWGGSRRTERILILDDTFSMGYESPDKTPFARAKIAVGRLIDSFQRETPDDAVTLLRASSPRNPVAAGAYLDPEQAEDLLARVEALAVSQQSMDLAAVFKAVAEGLQRDAGTVDAAIYFLSDFQRCDWSTSPGATRELASAIQPLQAWAAEDRSLRFFLVDVGEKDAANIALTDLQVSGGRPVAGTSAVVRATVSNLASRPTGALPVQVEVAQRAQTPKSLEGLGPFQQASLDVEASFVRSGDESVRVEIPRDALPVDNQRFTAIEVVTAIRILLVNGEPSADEYEDEVALLRTALRPEGEVFSGHEVVVVDEAGLETTNLSGFHAVILANVYRVAEPAVEALERFARAGGGVVIFLGDQVDAKGYNELMHREGAGLLPAQLGEILRPAEPAALIISDRLHPALGSAHRGEDPLGIKQIPFFEYISTTPHTPSTGDAGDDPEGPGSETTGNEGNAAQVLARFADADQTPALIERSFGAGRVLLVTTSADKEWNSWADHPTYLPLVTELLRHVTSAGGRPIDYRVGAPIDLRVEAGQFDSTAAVRTPGYPNEPEATATLLPGSDDRGQRLHWEHTPSAGMYQFVLRRLDGVEVVRLAAVNVDPSESDLAAADEKALSQTMAGTPYTYIKGLDQLATATTQARTELWTSALLAAFLVLMTEQTLAWRWGRNR